MANKLDIDGRNVIIDLEDLFKPKRKITFNDNIYYDTSPDATETLEDYEEPSASDDPINTQATISVDWTQDISPHDTLYAQGVYGYDKLGTTITSKALILEVDSVDKDNDTITVHALNGKKIGNKICVPSIDGGTILVIMGSSNPIENYPIESESSHEITYNFQEFKLSFYEENTKIKGIIKNNNALNPLEKRMLHRFNIRKNRTFLFGNEDFANNSLINGIWNKAGREFFYNSTNMTEATYADLANKVFSVQEDSSSKKIILAGCEFITKFCNLLGNNTLSYDSPFGLLEVYYYPIFDYIDAGNAIVIDPKHIKIYNTVPLRADFTKLPEEGASYMTFSETSAIVLAHPKTHIRIIRV